MSVLCTEFERACLSLNHGCTWYFRLLCAGLGGGVFGCFVGEMALVLDRSCAMGRRVWDAFGTGGPRLLFLAGVAVPGSGREFSPRGSLTWSSRSRLERLGAVFRSLPGHGTGSSLNLRGATHPVSLDSPFLRPRRRDRRRYVQEPRRMPPAEVELHEHQNAHQVGGRRSR